MTPIKTKQIMDAESINRSITRVAHEILEHNRGPDNIILIGILTRGEPLAKRLRKLIENITNIKIPIGFLDITFHRDDFRKRLVVPQVKGTDIHDSIDDKIVVLVDDVLFTGRTIRAAMEEIFSLGRPNQIQLAVLIDRGHRELPIKANYVGKNYPTSFNEHIHVYLNEIDKEESVELVEYNEQS